jgi:BirA family biotin operon repressor/biotin-[acetyl-CoA-carboxylase] ligase
MKNMNDIIWLDCVDSTNEEAKRHIQTIDNLSVLSALSQTAGRGQRGNSWHSAPGENLTFSIILKFSEADEKDMLPGISAKEQFILNELTALSVAEWISNYGIHAEIKWPNDIYVGKNKICGILIENSLRGAALSSSIIGIGLNINQRNFNVNLVNPTSMALCCPEYGDFDIRKCLDEFLHIFNRYLDEFIIGKAPTSELEKIYLSKLWRLDKVAEFIDYTGLPKGHLDGPMNINMNDLPENNDAIQAGRRFIGKIKCLSSSGNLLVEDLGLGETLEFSFKEIGYIL